MCMLSLEPEQSSQGVHGKIKVENRYLRIMATNRQLNIFQSSRTGASPLDTVKLLYKETREKKNLIMKVSNCQQSAEIHVTARPNHTEISKNYFKI